MAIVDRRLVYWDLVGWFELTEALQNAVDANVIRSVESPPF